MASLPEKNSERLRHSESGVYASATRSGSRVFHASSAACTFCFAVSKVNGGSGGFVSISDPVRSLLSAGDEVTNGFLDRGKLGLHDVRNQIELPMLAL